MSDDSGFDAGDALGSSNPVSFNSLTGCMPACLLVGAIVFSVLLARANNAPAMPIVPTATPTETPIGFVASPTPVVYTCPPAAQRPYNYNVNGCQSGLVSEPEFAFTPRSTDFHLALFPQTQVARYIFIDNTRAAGSNQFFLFGVHSGQVDRERGSVLPVDEEGRHGFLPSATGRDTRLVIWPNARKTGEPLTTVLIRGTVNITLAFRHSGHQNYGPVYNGVAYLPEPLPPPTPSPTPRPYLQLTLDGQALATFEAAESWAATHTAAEATRTPSR